MKVIQKQRNKEININNNKDKITKTTTKKKNILIVNK